MKERRALEWEKILNVILIILVVFMEFMFVFVNLMRYKLGLNADIAAEGLLAKVIWESKEWVPSEWYFSSEARLISVANCAALFYGMTKDICLSMGLAIIVAGIFVLAGLWYLGKELSFTMTQKLLLIFGIMILPNNQAMIELMFIHAGHYAFHIGLYFFTLALYLKMSKKVKIRKIEVIINLVLHLLIGIQGVRGILMITGPLMAVEFVRYIYLWWSKQKAKQEDFTRLFYVIAINLIGYLGGKVPLSVKYPLSRNIRKAPQKFFEIILPDFLNSLDWGGLSFIEKIIYIACLILIVYLAVDIIRKGIKRKSITEENWVFLNFFVSTVLTVTALIFTTVDSSSRYYVVIYFAISMGIATVFNGKNKFVKSMVLFVVGILFIGNFYKIYYPLIVGKSYEQNVYVEIGEYMIQEGYEYGYTDFNNANTITVYNDGKIQVSAIDKFSEMNVCKWITSKKWYVPNVPKNSKTAYIVPELKLEEMEEFLNKHGDDVEFKTQIGTYSIYGSEHNYSKLTD